MKSSLPSPFLRGLALAAALALAGCAALAPATPEQAVQERAGQYWQARIAGQYQQAYALTPPSYRKVRTLEQFRLQYGGPVSVQQAQVVRVRCETAQKCTALMKIGGEPTLPGIKAAIMSTHVDEAWVMEDGQWWHYQAP